LRQNTAGNSIQIINNLFVIDLKYLGSINVKEIKPNDLKEEETKTEISTEGDKVCFVSE